MQVNIGFLVVRKVFWKCQKVFSHLETWERRSPSVGFASEAAYPAPIYIYMSRPTHPTFPSFFCQRQKVAIQSLVWFLDILAWRCGCVSPLPVLWPLLQWTATVKPVPSHPHPFQHLLQDLFNFFSWQQSLRGVCRLNPQNIQNKKYTESSNPLRIQTLYSCSAFLKADNQLWGTWTQLKISLLLDNWAPSMDNLIF